MAIGIISLRFVHPTKDLDFLSSVLSMQCFRSWVAGSPRQTPCGDPLTGTNPYSYWASRLEYPCKNGFKEKLVYAIELLASAEGNLHDFRASGGKIEIYLQLPGSINNGDTIESKYLKALGEMGVDLLVEVFPGN